MSRPREAESKSRAPKRQRNVVANGFCKAGIKVVKCTLNSILRKDYVHAAGAQNLRQTLEELALFMSTQRVAASLVAKHHLFTHMEQKGQLDFAVDLTYFTRVFKSIRGTAFRACNYKSDLLNSAEVVCRAIGVTYESKLPGTVICQAQTYCAREMLTNFRTHLSVHLEDALNNWRNNHLRPFQPEETKWKSYVKSVVKCELVTVETTQVMQNYDLLKSEVPLMKVEQKSEEVDGTKKFKYNYEMCLAFMWKLRQQCERLVETTPEIKDSVKMFSVMPQCQVSLSSVRLDTIMLGWIYCQDHPHCFKPTGKKHAENPEPTKVDLCTHPAYSAQVWGEYFDLGYIQRKLVRCGDRIKFNWSIVTNGYTVSVTYQKYKRSVGSTLSDTKYLLNTVTRKPRLYSEKKLKLRRATDALKLNIWAIDPGVKDIIHVVHLNSRRSYRLTQKGYLHDSLMDWYRKWMAKSYAVHRQTHPNLKDLLHQKTSRSTRVQEYAAQYGLQFREMWAFVTRKQILKRKFTVWRRRKSTLDKAVAKVCNQTNNNVVIFGNGNKFGRSRGGGFKGPVQELRMSFSKKVPVICADEFRTSKSCLLCGHLLSHPKRELSFCHNTTHTRMLKRDKDAAHKIGYRSLAVMGKLDLGPFSRQCPKDKIVKWNPETSQSLWPVENNRNNSMFQFYELYRQHRSNTVGNNLLPTRRLQSFSSTASSS